MKHEKDKKWKQKKHESMREKNYKYTMGQGVWKGKEGIKNEKSKKA